MFYDWALTRGAQELANRTRNLILPANRTAEVRPEAARYASAPTIDADPAKFGTPGREEASARALATRDRRRAEVGPARRGAPLRSPIIRSVNEFELIARFFSRPPRAASVHLAVGDDAALLAPTPGCELAVSVDMLVGGRHFLRGHRSGTARPQGARGESLRHGGDGGDTEVGAARRRAAGRRSRVARGVRARFLRAGRCPRRRSRRRRHDARSAQSLRHDHG